MQLSQAQFNRAKRLWHECGALRDLTSDVAAIKLGVSVSSVRGWKRGIKGKSEEKKAKERARWHKRQLYRRPPLGKGAVEVARALRSVGWA